MIPSNPNELAQELIPKSANIIDVSSNQLIQHKVENNAGVRVNIDKKFLKDSESFWSAKGSEFMSHYQSGVFLGKGDHSNVLFSEFLKRFAKTIEQIIRLEMSKNAKTSEEFTTDIKTINNIFILLNEHLTRSNCEIKNEEFLAIIHGFINSYISSLN